MSDNFEKENDKKFKQIREEIIKKIRDKQKKNNNNAK